MKIRRAACFLAFLFFGYFSARAFLDLVPYYRGMVPAPEEILFLLPYFLIVTSLALSALYFAWRSHRAIGGDAAPSRGWPAVGEALAWMMLSFGLLGSSLAGLVLAMGHALRGAFTWALVYAGTTLLGVAALACLLAGAKAFRRRKLNPYKFDLE
jgi:vacuolar-type H+-ATPase subunit I/STV1